MIQHLKKKIEIYFDKSVIKNWSEPWKKSSLPLRITKKLHSLSLKNEKKSTNFFRSKYIIEEKLALLTSSKSPPKTCKKSMKKHLKVSLHIIKILALIVSWTNNLLDEMKNENICEEKTWAESCYTFTDGSDMYINFCI